MPLPVWAESNAYFGGAEPWEKEKNAFVDEEHEVSVSLEEKDGMIRLVTDINSYLPEAEMISSDKLGEAFEPEERFEAPDGSDIIFDTDYYGNKRKDRITAGPVQEVAE